MSRHVVSGILLDEHVAYTLEEVSEACATRVEWVIELVDEGILDPEGDDRRNWQFPGDAVHVAMKARRLQHDFGLNLAGVALVLELLDEIEVLRSRLHAARPSI